MQSELDTNALNELKQLVSSKKFIAFVGSGVSIPLYPSWSGALTSFRDKACQLGYLNDDADYAYITRQITADPLEAANTLEELIGRPQFRAMLSKTFQHNGQCTDAHTALSKLLASAYVTTNYDDGLSIAYSALTGRVALCIRQTDEGQLTAWRQDKFTTDQNVPIIHWHGLPASPDNMIFTASDYDAFYGKKANDEFLHELWRDKQLLVVGFGFSDPFLTRVAESVSRGLLSDNRHFALIGVPEDEKVSSLQRKEFSNKYRLTPIFYPVRNQGQDHSALLEALSYLQLSDNSGANNRAAPIAAKKTVGDGDRDSGSIVAAFESRLLHYNGQRLYVEPPLYRPTEIDKHDEDTKLAAVSVQEIADSDQNTAIVARPEYGSTTLGHRLATIFETEGRSCAVLSTPELHPYRAKLEKELPIPACKARSVLILDAFSPDQHERHLKEIISLARYERLIILVRSPTSNSIDILNSLVDGSGFSLVILDQLKPTHIRVLVEAMFDSGDPDYISLAVQKIYDDLLALCIPLTPPNVIMYGSVLAREGDFSPLNRVQIVERYLFDLLKGSADAWRGAFNARNRIDVVSSFVCKLFFEGKSHFSDADWDTFCTNLKDESLIEFDSRNLLLNLLDARVFVRDKSDIVFKYKFFYAYFLGRALSADVSALVTTLQSDRYLSVNGLVEVIVAIGNEGSRVVSDLTTKLTRSLEQIWTKYPNLQTDPFMRVQWGYTRDQDAQLWSVVSDELKDGPNKIAELDEFMRSHHAERRAEDQIISIHDINELERKAVSYGGSLSAALASAESLAGAQKKEAVIALLDYFRLLYMIGLYHAPAIARARIFYWNGMFFKNRLLFDKDYDENKRIFTVALAMSTSVAQSIVASIGSRKLASVYQRVFSETKWTGIRDLFLFSLIIRTKPTGWLEAARSAVNSTSRNSYYLLSMLGRSRIEYKSEINSNLDRGAVKRIIAAIAVKRELKKDHPAPGLIAKGLTSLEGQGYFAELDKNEN